MGRAKGGRILDADSTNTAPKGDATPGALVSCWGHRRMPRSRPHHDAATAHGRHADHWVSSMARVGGRGVVMWGEQQRGARDVGGSVWAASFVLDSSTVIRHSFGRVLFGTVCCPVWA